MLIPRGAGLIHIPLNSIYDLISSISSARFIDVFLMMPVLTEAKQES